MLVPDSAPAVPFRKDDSIRTPGAKMSDSVSSRCEKKAIASVVPVWRVPKEPPRGHTAPTDSE